MNTLYDSILAHQDPTQVEGLSRFFKTGKGQYGEGDKFLGIKVPVIREVVKQCWQDTSFEDLETCLTSEYHEMRMATLLALVQIFKHAKKDIALQQQCVDFYLAHTPYINNWDLVDLSCYELLGTWLLDKNRTSTYPYTEDGQKQFTIDLIAKLKQHSLVKGLFWWWPEDNGNKKVTNSWRNAALYNHNTVQPWPAFYELKNFATESSGLQGIEAEKKSNSDKWYTIDGRRLGSEPSKSGIYINNGKKKIVR